MQKYMDVIQVKNLTKKYPAKGGGLLAVDNISFTVNKGEIFGFLGPNGAGKSTTISMLSTIVTPTMGTAIVNNFDITAQQNDVRKSIGLVFQDPSLDDRLTADENLCFHAQLYGVPKGEYNKRIEDVLRLVDLWDRKDDIVKTYSGGMKRRLEIGRGLIHYPAVLFLDEPTLGLDPQTRANIWDYILKLKREKEMTIFMTTHYMNEAEYCDRIGIIDNGKIVALDTPTNLKKMLGGDIVYMETREKENLKEELQALYQNEVKEEGSGLRMEVTDGEKFLPRLFNDLKTKIDSIELRKPTLDDVFLHLTGRKIREEEATAKDFMRNQMRRRRG